MSIWMDVDGVLEQIGQGGKQQVKYVIVLCLFKVYAAFHVLHYSFVGRSTEFKCFTVNETLINQCLENSVSRCNNLTFSENTIVAEWFLVCDRNWMGKATMSSLMFGFLQGAMVLGKMADIYGRKSTLMLTLWGLILSNFLSSFTASYTVYLVARFLVGFFVAGLTICVSVLISELVGPSQRGVFGLGALMSFSVGIIALAFTASFYRDWRQLGWVVSLLGFPFLVCHWYMVESPRWLLGQHRQSEAESVLYTIAKGNGAYNKIKINLNVKPASETKNSSDSLLMMFSQRKLCLVSLLLCYNWFVNGASYYGMTLAAGSLGSDVYIGTALSGGVELPAVVLAYCLIEFGGRRVAVVGFMTSGGVFSLLVQIFKLEPAVGILLALLGKMCIAASFKTSYIISGEIFPTTIRTSGMGMVSASARLGSIISPFIVMVGETFPGVQFTVFAILGLSGGLLSLGLPETKGKPLPGNVGDLLGRRGKMETV